MDPGRLDFQLPKPNVDGTEFRSQPEYPGSPRTGRSVGCCWSRQHCLRLFPCTGLPDPLDTIVEDDVWIGGGSTVLVRITIGRGSIIATGTVVTRDVPPYSIVAGVPARVLRKRFENDEDERLLYEILVSGNFVSHYADSKQ